MKETGIIAKVDIFGRVKIPIDLMNKMGIIKGAEVKFIIDEKCIALKRTKSGFIAKCKSEFNKFKEIYKY